jgi:hypothetical protein
MGPMGGDDGGPGVPTINAKKHRWQAPMGRGGGRSLSEI